MTDLQTELRYFTGSETFWRHPLNRKAVYIDGIKHLAERAGAYWLIDDILAAYQLDPAIKGAQFQVWTLKRHKEGHAGSLRLEDGDGKHIKIFEIGFTDFPLKTITLWFINGTLMLPSEY